MDTIHMYLFSKTKGTVELMVHHAVVGPLSMFIIFTKR